MTAQMSVMNRKCIALATDSAVTRRNGDHCKAFNTADKLFQLGKHIPVGIMIYNNAEFLGIPWEVIIKQYQLYLGTKQYDTLYQYCEDFFRFVKEVPEFTDELKLNYVLKIIFNHIQILLNQIQFHISKVDDENDKEIIKKIILDTFLNYENNIKIKDLNKEDYSWISQCNENIYESLFRFINSNQLQFEQYEIDKMIEVLKRAAISEAYTKIYTGIVFAGYGESDWFPRLYNYEIEGFINNTLKYRPIKEEKIGLNKDERSSSIIPFAQSEMALSFITGMHPLLSKYLRCILQKLCDTDTVRDVIKEENIEINEQMEQAIKIISQSLPGNVLDYFTEFQTKEYINPLFNMVEGLDKSQMAELAETLVNLTLFKRKMSMDTNTVGGPIDVAIISKGEGFIWIKRKYYFKSDLNPSYINN